MFNNGTQNLSLQGQSKDAGLKITTKQHSSSIPVSQLYQQSNQSENTPLGSRQFESYLGRREVIQQQREKKQQLLKQLDEGRGNKFGQQSSKSIHVGAEQDQFGGMLLTGNQKEIGIGKFG